MITGHGREDRATGHFVLPLMVAVLAVYYLSLSYVFPGYFRPLTPHHVDLYQLVQGDDTRLNLSQMFWRHRVVGWIFVDPFSGMGLAPMLAAFSAVALGGVTLTIVAMRPLTARRPSRWALIVLYLVNVFCAPDFT